MEAVAGSERTDTTSVDSMDSVAMPKQLIVVFPGSQWRIGHGETDAERGGDQDC